MELREALNALHSSVVESDDINLINLFQRAVRNFNSFSPLQTEPITPYYKHYQAPPFSIPEIKLTIDVKEGCVTVTSKLTVHRTKGNVPLILGCYHDSQGQGYAYAVDKILKLSAFNPYLAHNYVAVPVLQDIDSLSNPQRTVLLKEMQRLKIDAVPPQTRDLVKKIINKE